MTLEVESFSSSGAARESLVDLLRVWDALTPRCIMTSPSPHIPGPLDRPMAASGSVREPCPGAAVITLLDGTWWAFTKCGWMPTGSR